MKFKTIAIILSLMIVYITGLPANVPAQKTVEPFPEYDAVSANVDFWTKVYAVYSTNQGIIHDSQNLSIIYAVIDLKPESAPGATRTNRKRMKQATEKYIHILNKLAVDPTPVHLESRRIAELFGNSTTSGVYKAAAQNVRCQVGQKDRFQAGLIRSGAYLDQIRDIFRAHGLPEELGYLPHVESSFNPKAYSKFGAAGIWQFTRSTGRRFMTVGYDIDERRDPIMATYAAAQLLKENYEKLGSWPLAITAYNHGAAGMLRARQAHGDYPSIINNYRSRTFKFASRNFYSEFLAARQVAADYKRYFGELDLKPPQHINSLVLDGYVAFKDVCRHLELEPQELKALNPALREPVFEGQKHIPKGYSLRLPIRMSDLNANTLAAALPESLFHSSQKPSRFYTVQRHDTAGKIAKMHGVKLQDLILANNLNRRATIYPHQTLRIPVPGEPAASRAQPIVAAKATPQQPEKSDTQAGTETVTYQQPVLASIIPLTGTAANDNDTVTNEMPTDVALPTKMPAALNSEVVMADVGFIKVFELEGRSVGVIRMEVEETLGHYAEWAGVKTQQIRYLNNLKYGVVLHLHQTIKIPLYRTTPEQFTQNRYEHHKRLQEDFFSVYRVTDTQPYTVAMGDNYWTLCRSKFEIPLWLLKHYNPDADLADLIAGQQIMIPEIDKGSTEDAAESLSEEGAWQSRAWPAPTTVGTSEGKVLNLLKS